MSCSVCGRTILKGERTRTYLTPDDEGERTVCELCRSRAEALGWVWAEDANLHRPQPSRRRRRASLSGWLRGLRADGSEPQAVPGSEEVAGSEAPPASEDVAGSEAPPAKPNGVAAIPTGSGSPDPAARGARVGRAGAIREPGTRLERAVARFNESEHARTVAGLTRTLGEPRVSVGAAAGSPNEIRLTVAWELSWYQWGVDLGEPSRAVYEIDKGHELGEIDASAREWNAQVAEGNGLQLGITPPHREGQPAHSES